MTTVLKETTLPELREMVEDAEHLDRVTFDPRDGSASFALEDRKLRFRHGQREYGMSGEAYKHLCRKLGIPQAYLTKTPHDLMVPHVNYWMAQGRAPIITYGVQDDVVRLFSYGATQPVGVGAVLDVLEPMLGDHEPQVHHVSHDLRHTSFSVTTQENEAEAQGKVGEALRTGVTVDASYFGASPFTVSAYVQRLICTNGMVSTDNTYRHSRRPGADQSDLREWINDALTDALDAGSTELDSLSRLQALTFDGHLSDAMGSIFAEFSVPRNMQERIRNEVIDEAPETMYDLLNVITDIASNDEGVLDDPALSRRLMHIGGSIAAHPEFCESCYRVLG